MYCGTTIGSLNLNENERAKRIILTCIVIALCIGGAFLLKNCNENYVVEINYYYIRNRIEVYFSALCHPESIYREEIDLSEVSTGRDQSGDGSTNQGTVL